MKLIEVPVYTDEGELRFTSTITMDEAQLLLQFAINLKMAMASQLGVAINVPATGMGNLEEHQPRELDD